MRYVLDQVIHHVSFKIARNVAQECLGFYELLGFTPIPPPESLADRSYWLDRDGAQIHLMFNEADGEQVTDVTPSEVADHVALVVTDYEEAVAALGRSGISVEARAQHWGSPRGYVRDPAGNLLELMEWAP
ncbi:MAG: VOC family protein [Solirubrobacterales bacterium]